MTERCNNACLHCYINLPKDDPTAIARELSTDRWKNILQQAADLGALTVRFTGGEPLLRDDFSELYLFARRLGLRVMLFTNARLITPELADLFVQIPPLKKIEISVYGMRPESYDAVAARPGAFAEFKRGIELLDDRKIAYVIKTALLPQNSDDLEALEEWVARNPWMNGDPALSCYFDLRARRDSIAKNELIRSLRISPEKSLVLLARREAVYRKEMAGFCAKFCQPSGDLLFNCGAGKSGCVDAYGKYQMCLMLRHPQTVFDLAKGSLREALTEFFPRLRELKATNPDYLQRCAQCFLYGLCEQCPAKSWAEHGTLDTPVDYFCQIAHAQARFLGLLKSDEMAWEVKDWGQRIDSLAKS
ncbi:radical SAM protein [candidate division KSB1 bacterium]|nr:radical SAM protein [candidate division KSB1 bacterium]